MNDYNDSFDCNYSDTFACNLQSDEFSSPEELEKIDNFPNQQEVPF